MKAFILDRYGKTNSVRAGTLVAHRTFTYFTGPDSALVRGAVHSETLLSADSGERAVIDTTFSNIGLELRRQP